MNSLSLMAWITSPFQRSGRRCAEVIPLTALPHFSTAPFAPAAPSPIVRLARQFSEEEEVERSSYAALIVRLGYKRNMSSATQSAFALPTSHS